MQNTQVLDEFKEKKVVVTNKERCQEPNVQTNDEHDLKQNVVAAMNLLG